LGGRRNRKQPQAVRTDRDATKEELKRRDFEARKGATLAFIAEKNRPWGERVSAAALGQHFSVLPKLIPIKVLASRATWAQMKVLASRGVRL
jgi:hypothetical protein